MGNSDLISVLDTGLGNVASVANMIRRVGGQVEIVSSPLQIREAKKLILPGVGAFDSGIKFLQTRGIDDAIREAVASGSYLLGICLGMQMLLERSEEGRERGLSLISGSVRKFAGGDIRIPHMGWNIVRPVSREGILPFLDEDLRFYFVHSFYCETDEPFVAGKTQYGLEFTSAIQKGRVFGVQFHPEKSHRFGMALFKQFLELSE